MINRMSIVHLATADKTLRDFVRLYLPSLASVFEVEGYRYGIKCCGDCANAYLRCNSLQCKLKHVTLSLGASADPG